MSHVHQPFRIGFSCSTDSVLILGDIAPFVELYGKFSLILFCEKVWKKYFKDFITSFCTHMGNVKKAVLKGIFAIPCCVEGELESEVITEGFNGPRVSHLDTKTERIGRRDTTISRLCSLDGNATFSINQSCEVRFVHPETKDSTNGHKLQEFFIANRVNSGNPLTGNAEGNPEPSQGYILGRCRDYWRGLVLLITSLSARLVRDDIVRAS